MEAWLTEHWFDLFQTAGIVGGLLFSAYTTHQDEKARRIENVIAINEQYGRIWRELYEQPRLSRVLKKDVNLTKEPISEEEWRFVKMLILHLDTVRRAMKARMLVKIEGMQDDIRQFFSLPIPKAVWERIKPFQDRDFVKFIDSCVRVA
jgi:hypothetical protein